MSTRNLIIAVLATVIFVVGGVFAYLWFAGGSGEPSTELTTPTIAPDTTVDEGTGSTTASETTAGTDAGTTTPASVGVAFVIDPARSVATFEIDEVLRGEPKRVIGTTSEVAGQFLVDVEDLSTVEFSQMLVNARTFQTDSGNRDRAIRGPVVLNSADDAFEFITFDVTALEGLDGELGVGESTSFSMTGDLVIRGTSNPVTFDVTASMVDESTIEGTAEATVLRSDYGIGIPSAPGVADVGDEVVIRLEFVATT